MDEKNFQAQPQARASRLDPPMGAVPWLRPLAGSLLLPIAVRANHDAASQNGYNASDFNETMTEPDGTCNVDAAVGPLNPDAFHVCGSASTITCHSIYVSGGVGSSQGAIERARCGFADFFAPECCRTGGYEIYDPSNSAHVSSFDANQVKPISTDDGSWYRDDLGSAKSFVSHCEAGGAQQRRSRGRAIKRQKLLLFLGLSSMK